MTHSIAGRARRHAALAATIVLAAAAPAAAQKNRADVLLSDRPAPRHDCRIADTPRRLPAASELTDSTGLAQGLAAYAAKYPISGDHRMYAVYSIGLDAGGRVERLQAVDYLLPQGYEAELTELVRSSIRAQHGGNPVSLRLRVDPGEQPAIRVGRSERCPPQANMRFEVLAPAALVAQHPSPMRVNVVVDSAGHVLGTRIVNPSGDTSIDEWVESNLTRNQFSPGLIDGFPVMMETEASFMIRSR